MGLLDWWNTGYVPSEKSMSLLEMIEDELGKLTKSDESFKKYGNKGIKGWNPAKAFTPEMLKTGPTPLARYAIPRMGILAEAFYPSNNIMTEEEEFASMEYWKQRQLEEFSGK